MIDDKSSENLETMKPSQISRKRKCNQTASLHVNKYRIISTNDSLSMNSSAGYLTQSTLEFQRPVPGTGAEINLLSSQETILTNDLFLSSRPENQFFETQIKECNNLQDSLSNLAYASSSSILQRTKALIIKFKNSIDYFTDYYKQKIIRSIQERNLLLQSNEFELEAIKEERMACEKQMASILDQERLVSEPTMNDKPTEQNVDQEIRPIPKLIISNDQDDLPCENASNDLNKHIKPHDKLVKVIDNPDQFVSDYNQLEQTKDLQFLANDSPQELIFLGGNIQIEENKKQTNSPKEQCPSSDKELVNSVNKIDQDISHDNQLSSPWLKQSGVDHIQNEEKESEPIMLQEEENKHQHFPTNSQINVMKNIIKSLDFSTIKSPNSPKVNSSECVKEEEVVKNEEKDEVRNRKRDFIQEAALLKDLFGSRNRYFTLTETQLCRLNISIKNKNYEFPPLTIEMMHRYNDLMEGHPDDEIISKFNLHIKRDSIRSLSGSNWLDDEVVNFYMNLISQRSEMEKNKQLPSVYCMNTFFIPIFVLNGYAAVRRWTYKIDIFTKDIIVVPVYADSSHWCVAIIHMRQRTLHCYDSLGRIRPHVLDALKSYLILESQDKHKKIFDTNTLLIDDASDAPIQRNSNDCGVFSCMVAEYITRDQPLTFTQSNIPYLRVKMALEISEGKLWL